MLMPDAAITLAVALPSYARRAEIPQPAKHTFRHSCKPAEDPADSPLWF
jgi:hypothetical protein